MDRAELRQTVPGRLVVLFRHDVPLILLDLLAVFAAYLAALLVRLNFDVPADMWAGFRSFFPALMAAHLLANYLFGLYGQMWRYASVQEARRLGLAGITAAVLVMGADQWLGIPMPRSAALMGAAGALVAFGAIRFQSRLFGFRRREVAMDEGRVKRVLVMGAGDSGAQLLSDVLRHPEVGLRPVGMVDDDPRRQRLALHGVRVLGTRDDIPSLAHRYAVDEVLLAVPSATSEVIRDVARRSEEAGVSLRVLPSVRQLVGGRVGVRDLRDLHIEDLLGRRQVETDLEAVGGLLRGKRVLITGAGGSIGCEIARQVAGFEPDRLLLLDGDETHLHDLLVSLGASTKTVPVLADVRDRTRMVELFLEHQPQVVFHAAAHKHVPLLEDHPQEALATNVLGTANVADAAVTSGAERFVLISTDKAIRPSSVMGASKRLAEDVVRSLSGRGTVLCAVRFGNVLGSRGSVIPTFLRQIQAGGPVTVTDPAMTRYFMSVQEAVQLVLQAAALSGGGEVFTLEMGEAVNILDLARKLIHLSGRVPDRDVRIEICGIRPGEKLHEELVDADERPMSTDHPGIVAAASPVPDRALLRARLSELEGLAGEGRLAELAELMRLPVGPTKAEAEPVEARLP